MDLELVKFINSDLTWNAVKKGHRSTIRRPRKPATTTSEFDYEKSGVAILGQHFGEEVLDIPIKKRILMLQSPSLSNERERSRSTKSKKGSSTNSEQSKLIPDLNDFSGIELLAAAACHSSVYDNTPAPMESSAIEEHTTKPRVESYTDIVVKDDIAPIDSDDSSVQDPVAQNVCDTNGKNEEDEKRPVVAVASKDVRLHWDLNTVMDDWEEEPCCDILVDPHSEKAYLKEGYETTISQVTEGQQEVKSEGRQAVSEVVQDDDKVTTTSEDRLSDCCGSNSVDKVKAGGYDSPVEDGELRGDTWQKNEVEEMECVDYESDNIYEDNFDTIESVDNEVVVVPNNETDQQDDKKNVPSISNQLPEHSQGAISEEKDRIPSFGLRKNDASIRRSRSENIEDCYSRGKRDFGQEKSTGRNGASYNHMGGWDSRNNGHRYYPSSRPKHVIGGSSVRERDTHPIVSYNNNNNSRVNYKTLNTRPERSEPYGVHNRGFIRDKYKGGLGFHLQESRREEPKVSSGFNRGAHISRSRRRSRSRSRSESPIAWNFQKKRNVDTKRESPDHRADVRFQGENINGQYRDRRASPAGGYNIGRLKSSDHFGPTSSSRSGRFPPQPNGQYDDKYGGGHFRYHHVRNNKDNNGFRYNNSRNENRYFKDSVGDGDFHKGDLQRE